VEGPNFTPQRFTLPVMGTLLLIFGCLVLLQGILATALALSLERSVFRRTPGFLLGAVTLLICVLYIYQSRENPRFVELTMGSFALAGVLGVVSSMVTRYMQGWPGSHTAPHGRPTSREVNALLVLPSIVALLLCVLIYSTNSPQPVSKELDMNYVISESKLELPIDLLGQRLETNASVCYQDVQSILNAFKKRSADNMGKIQQLVRVNGSPISMVTVPLVRDLATYSIVYCLGQVFSSPEIELSMYRKAVVGSWGIPANNIKGQPITLEKVSGAFKENLFFGLSGNSPNPKVELTLPRDTKITADPDPEEPLISRIILRNDFTTVTIGVQALLAYSGGEAMPAPEQLLGNPTQVAQYADFLKKEGPFKQYHVKVYLDATFSRLRFGYPQMKSYQLWVNDLFSVIERKFAWGNPKLLDPSAVRKQIQGLN
jgi:hypothetical protein